MHCCNSPQSTRPGWLTVVMIWQCVTIKQIWYKSIAHLQECSSYILNSCGENNGHVPCIYHISLNASHGYYKFQSVPGYGYNLRAGTK